MSDVDATALFPALQSLLARVGALLDAAADAGALCAGDAALRTGVLWITVHGATQLRKLDRFGVAPLLSDAVSQEAVETLLVGWGARPRTVRAALRRVGDLKFGPREPSS